MIRYVLMLCACLLAVPLAACESVAEQCAKAANPVECAKVADAGGDVNDYLLYGMAGYMLSSAINGSGQRQPVIVADPNYHGHRRAIPSYQASPGFVRSRTVTTTTRRTVLGGTKTSVTTTRSYSRPASYRSSFSYRPSSSYRSFSRFR